MDKNTVSYSIIMAAKNDIIGSADAIQQKAAEISNEVSEAFGSNGTTSISGESGEVLATAWEKFSGEAFPNIKQKLAELVDVKLTKWKEEYEKAETEIESAAQNYTNGN